MNKKPFIVPIPGTTKLSHLEENLRATEIIFMPQEMKELEDTVAAIPIIGSRYDALQESKIQKWNHYEEDIYRIGLVYDIGVLPQ